MTGRAALVLSALLVGCGGETPTTGGRVSVTDALRGSDVAGYARAIEPRTFRFPADHGAHPGFRSEWWYFTGNLDGADGRRFGYHVTFFRGATRAGAPRDEGSAWRSRQLWMAHFALCDAQAGVMRAAERFARGALGLAGATTAPFAVHVDDWSVESVGGDFAPLRLRAQDDTMALELELMPQKPVVLQGDDGLSQKGPTPGNASYYYSITRMAAHGTVTLDGAAIAVEGSGWCDREWSTSALDQDQVGWDWFALQLDDGRDLMFYRLRHADGSSDAASRGVLVAADGTATKLAWDDVELETVRTWTSPRSGATYPSEIRITIPAHALVLDVVPVLDDQELDLSFRYWEGAVDVRGSHPGRGYLEMTGYADRRESR